MNYDMATDRTDLFGKVLSILAMIARGSGPQDPVPSARAPQETAALKLLALQGIVTLVKSLSIIVDMSLNTLNAAATSPPTTRADVDEEGGKEEEIDDLTSVAGQSLAPSSLSLVEDYDLRVRLLCLLYL